jgi:autonomous glycyl radical cofactor GrcA
MTWKVTYKSKVDGEWRIMYRVLQANSKEDAIKKMDLWPDLILKVELV